MGRTGIDVDSMRRIDRIAGVPLCFLASGFLKIWRRLRPRPPRPIRRILFIELSEMGSAILADPAMRKARERTGAENYFVIFTQNAGSLSIMGTIDPCNVFTIGTSSLWQLAIDTLGFLRWTRRNAIDTVVDLELFSRFTALLTGLSGAERRIGFHRFYNEGLYRGEMLTHRVAYNPHIHIAKNFIALIDALLSKAPTVPYSKTVVGDDELTLPVRPLSAAARDRVDTKIRTLAGRDPARPRLVLINANASDMLPQRRWMRERFRRTDPPHSGGERRRFRFAHWRAGRAPRRGGPGSAMRQQSLHRLCGTYGAGRPAGALCAGRGDGEQRFRTGAFCRSLRPADDRSVWTGNAALVSAARQFDRALRWTCLLPVREREQSPQKRVQRQCLHAGNQRRAGVQGGR